MATWKTVDDFYEHSDVATVRIEDLHRNKGRTSNSNGVSYYLAHILLFIDRNIGLRHLFLLVILTIYSLIGGYVIYYFETNGEAEGVPARKAELDNKIMEIIGRYKSGNSNITLSEKTAALKKDYITMLSTDGLFKWSTYYKTDEPDHWKWTFGSSFFYSMNVYTTVGYGSIAPETTAARCFTIIYGIIFCPLTWIIIRDIGQLALVYLTTVYARLKLKFTNAGEKADQVFMVPVFVCIGIGMLIMLFGTLWVHSYDALSGPPGSGLEWFLSLYFTFQTFTTIGLGDVMPNNIPFDPIICTVFFFSLPMIKVINRMCYLSMENGVHGGAQLLCTSDGAHNERHRPTKGNVSQWTGNELIEGPALRVRWAVVSARTFAVVSAQLYNYCHQSHKTKPVADIKASTSDADENIAEETDITNQLTIHSIATFMQSNADVYGGQLGRVNLLRSDIIPE